jgi:hypothetical protein
MFFFTFFLLLSIWIKSTGLMSCRRRPIPRSSDAGGFQQ